jgi:glutathione S-transferase
MVRTTLFAKGLKMEMKDTAFNPENRAELIAGGGKGQVPCLRIEKNDGSIEWMYESGDINHYIKTKLYN